MLVLNAARNCPADRFRSADGHPDATALTHCGPEEASRILDGLQPINRYADHRGITAEDLAQTDRHVAEVACGHLLIRTALRAAPRLTDVAAALRPAADSPRAVVAVTALATIALRKIASRPNGSAN